ncbi:MAG: ornithine carbamoyltransferase [Candidatus Omnitrophica bacterium]|nr:ornithine carbamoyltransferase [Candidatus Omnitrophota bacterium]
MTGQLKHLVTIRDFSKEEILALFRSAEALKKKRIPRNRPLAGKTLGLLFYKPSVRTRVSFEVGMTQLGGQSLYIGPVELGQGKRESAKDVAKVLSRYLDGIVARTFAHADVEEMAQQASIPVINGLSDDSHPCQALADLFTVREKLGRLQKVTLAYVGDGNNVCHSLLEICARLGVHLTISTPADYRPDSEVFEWAVREGQRSGSRIQWSADPREAARGAEVVYTDVWASMGQESEKESRAKIFQPFQVNTALMKQAGPKALFMHCLPAHRGDEVTDEVMDSRASVVYDQAENRLHIQKAILLEVLK